MSEGERRVEVPMTVTEELLKIVPEHEIRERVQYLVSTFKQEYENLFHVNIDEHSFLYLAHLSLALESLEGCEGFDKHIAEFQNDVSSTYLVTTLAAHLLPQVHRLELEPPPSDTGKRADIRVEFQNGQELFFECKNPKREIMAQLHGEAESMYEVLKDHILRPCDVTITYDEPLAESDLAELGQFLEERLPAVTGEGNISDRQGVQVDVTRIRESWEDIGEVLMQFVLPNRRGDTRNPITAINRGGLAMMFVKSGAPFVSIVEQQMKASRGKVSSNAPLVLALQSNLLAGPVHDNVRAVSAQFQPEKHTSFNGVVLMQWSYNFDVLIEHEFDYVNNPYARNPVSDLEALFRPH